MSKPAYIPGNCSICKRSIYLDSRNVVVTDNDILLAVCPAGNHFIHGQMSATAADYLRGIGAESLADQAERFLREGIIR